MKCMISPGDLAVVAMDWGSTREGQEQGGEGYEVRLLAELPGVSGERLAKYPALPEREICPRGGSGYQR